MTPAVRGYVADDSDSSARDQRDAAMQRVRVGLTGLAAVFLLTLLAASILGMFGQDDPHRARLANGSAADIMAAESPKEPLAELGVAPGGNPPNTQQAMAQPATIAPPPPARRPGAAAVRH